MKNDQIILDALTSGVLRYDQKTGSVFAPRSNTPDKPVGAITKKGYLRTCITQKDKAATVMVHRIACIAAYGLPAPILLGWAANARRRAMATKPALPVQGDLFGGAA